MSVISNTILRNDTDTTLKTWREKEKIALQLAKLVGDLRFDKSIELVLFRRDIYDTRPSQLLADHLLAENYIGRAINIEDTIALAKAIAKMDELPPARIDLGKLCTDWMKVQADFTNIEDFVAHSFKDFVGQETSTLTPKDIVLYGFGRIGRLAARRIVSLTGKGEQLRLKAIVLRPKMKDVAEELEKRAALLRTDSVHGDFGGNVIVDVENQSLIINGNQVKVIFAGHPTEVDYTKHGIHNALVIDNTGVWRDHASLSNHLQAGASQVMLTAPGKDIPNIVYGVNETDLNIEEDNIMCAASCTTNAIAPILKVLEDTFSIEKGHIETIHSYTSDQNLLDNFHKKPRRGRGAATNMVLTSTGAASAVSKVIPRLGGILTGNAVRVPTPNVSLAIMSLTLTEATTVEAINEAIKEAAFHGDLVEQIHYSTSTEYVSSNAIGMTTTSVLDAPSTIVSKDGKNVTVYAWYDNEYGYTCQVVRLAKHVAKVRRVCYY